MTDADSSERISQRWLETIRRYDPYMELISAIASYLTTIASAWILASLLFDIPAPGIVETAPEYPEAALFLMALALLIMSKNAAKWHRHRFRDQI